MPGETGQSQFLGKIDPHSYPAAQAPDEPPAFRWNFANNKTYAYLFQQRVVSCFDLGSPSPTKQSMSANAGLLLKAKGDNTADMFLKDMKAVMSMDFGSGEEKTMRSEIPAVVVQGVKEDGGMEVGSTGTEMLLKLLFPLPPKPLKVGEFAEIPLAMPFNASGSVLQVKGAAKVTLTGYVTIEERLCARLETQIDISKMEVPKEIKGSYACTTRGKSVFYFDIKERAFVSGTMALLMQVRGDIPMPKVEIDGEPLPPDMPKSSKIAMDNDNFIVIVRKAE